MSNNRLEFEIAYIETTLDKLNSMARNNQPLSYEVIAKGAKCKRYLDPKTYDTPDEFFETDGEGRGDVYSQNGSRRGFDGHVLGSIICSSIIVDVFAISNERLLELLRINNLTIVIKSDSYNFCAFGVRSCDLDCSRSKLILANRYTDINSPRIKNILQQVFGKESNFKCYLESELDLDFDKDEIRRSFAIVIDLSFYSENCIGINTVVCEIDRS